MNSRNRAIVFSILVTLCLTLALTLWAWHRVVQLEDELAVQKANVYILKMVQAELLKQHGLSFEFDQSVPTIGHHAVEDNK